MIILFFIILSIPITIGTLYAAVLFIANERAIKRSYIRRNKEIEKICLEIHTTCKEINNAKNDKNTATLNKIEKTLSETARHFVKYYLPHEGKKKHFGR